jgi:diguanylate cyclase
MMAFVTFSLSFMSTQVHRKGKRQSMTLPRRFYLPRCVGLSMGFLAVYASLPARAHGWPVLALLIGYCFLWPHLAYQCARRSDRPLDTERHSMLADAFSSGFFAGAMGFNPIPSVAILSMVSMNNMAMGGPRFMLSGALASLLGAGMACFALQVPFSDGLGHAQIAACLPLMVLYPLSLGYVSYRTAIKLGHHKNQLSQMSRTDHLTGLANRAALNDILDDWMRAPGTDKDSSALALIDVDGFKDINDRFGHIAGDRALQEIAGVMASCVGGQDTVARYGGDEFCVILRNRSRAEAERVFERMRALAQGDGRARGEAPAPTLSIGAAMYSREYSQDCGRDCNQDCNQDDKHDAGTGALWIHSADAAMYAAKKGGRNRVCFAGADGPAGFSPPALCSSG